MAVTTKRRRKIVCLEQQYVWYIQEDYDSDRLVLHIVSHDKKLILGYPLHMKIPYVISKGMVFQNYPNTGTWQRYLFPFEEVSPVTPKFVADIILWAINGKDAVSVDWNSKDIFL